MVQDDETLVKEYESISMSFEKSIFLFLSIKKWTGFWYKKKVFCTETLYSKLIVLYRW